jgi:hypothetical protein
MLRMLGLIRPVPASPSLVERLRGMVRRVEQRLRTARRRRHIAALAARRPPGPGRLLPPDPSPVPQTRAEIDRFTSQFRPRDPLGRP